MDPRFILKTGCQPGECFRMRFKRMNSGAAIKETLGYIANICPAINHYISGSNFGIIARSNDIVKPHTFHADIDPLT